MRCGSCWTSTRCDPESDLIVIYDELDLPLGTIRIRQRGSSAGHNGMESIIGALGTQEFLRIRLGIAPETKILKPFSKRQLKVVDGVLDTAAEAVKVILTEGPGAAMNRFNRKKEDDARTRTRRERFGEKTNESYLRTDVHCSP